MFRCYFGKTELYFLGNADITLVSVVVVVFTIDFVIDVPFLVYKNIFNLSTEKLCFAHLIYQVIGPDTIQTRKNLKF